ncbi:MAG: DUF6324 family protein [Pseudomonadota bacterium]
MGINSESNLDTNLQIGPTSEGMVRIYVTGSGVDLPMDFDPDDADEIAQELMAAAARVRGKPEKSKKKR